MPEGRPRRTEHGDKQRKAKPSGWQLVAVQSISCGVVILLVIILKIIGGSAFSQLRDSFNKSIMSNSIIATLAALIDPPNENTGVQRTEITTHSDQESESEQTTSASATTDTGGLSENTAPSGTTPTTVSKTSSANTATGGKDIPVIQKNVSYTPEGASFVPLKVNKIAYKPLKIGRATSLFGYRKNKDTGVESFHQGLDIAVEPGAPIAAMYFGVVSEVGANSGYGNYARIYHGNGIEVLYAHCSQILVDKGAVIRAGEVVAHVGSTGDSTGPHVHIEVTLHSIAYNPADIIPMEHYG